MFRSLPKNPEVFMNWGWPDFEGLFRSLQARPLSQENVGEWLVDWSAADDIFYELAARLYVAVSINTADHQAEERYKAFFDEIYPRVMEAQQALKQILLNSGLEPPGYAVPLRNMRAEADLYRAENLPVLAEENKLKIQYEKILGKQTVSWEGQERTVDQMRPVFQDPDRSRREQAWRLVAERQLADREAINRSWGELLSVRCKIAENAGRPNYREYRWQELLRFDYTPADARSFQDAIEEVVVPAAQRIYQRRCERLGLDTLRPWDLDVDVYGLPPLRPFTRIDELVSSASRIFHKVDPVLGSYFDQMSVEGLLDLENRKNKSTGAYCTGFPVVKRPFIFGNSVGIHEDVQMLLHESGHAFHVFEAASLTSHRRNVPMEFAEVASMAMELLASPYLAKEQGGFYTTVETARARIEHLETSIRFWPYMAVVDGFQHWVYENAEKAAVPEECDAVWSRLWKRFMTGVDWNGLEDEMATGWHRKPHIHTDPFYYVEYGLAQLGAIQVWGNSLRDQAKAVAAYRKALSLGGSVTLPELFKTAGAFFAFDANVLREAVGLMEETIENLQEDL